MKQTVWIAVGFLIMVSVSWMQETHLEEISYGFYVVLIISLVAVLLFGRVVGGARRWIVFGPVSFQASELGKILFILAISRYFSDRFTTNGMELKDLLVPFLMTIVPFLLIAAQPDLGTGGIYVLIFLGISFIALLRVGSVSKIVISGLVVIPVLWTMMKGYQKQRVLTFLNPEKDPFGAGYHIIQSKIAIGSGGLWGKGFLRGTQGQLRFLPEQHTDFAFSVVAEEWGFLICLAILILFLLFITRVFYIARQVNDRYSSFVISGIGIYFLLQVFINMAMVMGMFPVVGVPLPFISYGGSSMIANMFALGIVINLSKHRHLL
jgi:rod shape determining protein RodA